MKRFSNHLVAPAAFALIFFFALTTKAQGVPENLQAAIFFKVLAYDYNIQSKTGTDVTIAVVTDTKTASRQAAALEGFNKLKGQQLGGKNIHVIVVKLASPASINDAADADILYLPEGADDQTIEALIAFAEKNKRATLGGSEALAEKGCAIGLGVEAGKPKIIINLPASQAQGMNLSSKVLRLAKVIQ